ncbi:unnamed protein product [Somion occarium]|uniref:C2H2-type domain-containing protein n=1 Tax=Somion occarium TaxID=3059160 RepID=A0ABP1CZ36_9APHY
MAKSPTQNHQLENPYRRAGAACCIQCNKRFSSKAAIEQHLEEHPDGIDLEKCYFKCPYPGCTFKCLQESNWRNSHVNKHTGKKPHTCPDTVTDEHGNLIPCDYRSGDPGTLNRHRQGRHNYQTKKRAKRCDTGLPKPKVSTKGLCVPADNDTNNTITSNAQYMESLAWMIKMPRNIAVHGRRQSFIPPHDQENIPQQQGQYSNSQYYPIGGHLSSSSSLTTNYGTLTHPEPFHSSNITDENGSGLSDASNANYSLPFDYDLYAPSGNVDQGNLFAPFSQMLGSTPCSSYPSSEYGTNLNCMRPMSTATVNNRIPSYDGLRSNDTSSGSLSTTLEPSSQRLQNWELSLQSSFQNPFSGHQQFPELNGMFSNVLLHAWHQDSASSRNMAQQRMFPYGSYL